MPHALHQPLDQFDGCCAQAGEVDRQLIVLAGGGKFRNGLVVELAGTLHFVDARDRPAEVARSTRLAQDLI
ncbi:MAG: hypothetical protein WA196_04595, partial [Pseudolabrys sp.]